MFRVGIGMDSHRFEDKKSNKPLKLGGITIPDHIALNGKSDADVVLHALFNAISQSLGKRSIGYYCEPLFNQKGVVSSEEYLKLPIRWLSDCGYIICNIGITIECQTPKIEPFSEEIKKNIALLFSLDENQIGINATSGEDITPFGLGEGIQVFAIVSIVKQ